MNQKSINERAQYILKILVERYISEGQPVASRAIADSLDGFVSSATIRNVMADLERLGYLTSPHTSAGRIPTAQGYRFFIDSLLTVSALNDKLLKDFQEQFDATTEPQKLLQTASNLISNITQLAGIVSLPKKEQQILRQIEFLSLSNKRILVILVFNEKEIQNRIFESEREYTPSELNELSNYLTEQHCGNDLRTIRNNITVSLKNIRNELHHLMNLILKVADTALEPEKNDDFIMVGEGNLLEIANERGIKQLQELFNTFSQKQAMIALLDHCISADGIHIFIGEESANESFAGCSLITAPYQVDSKTVGVLGVIGPSRMAYEQVIPIVDVSAKLLSMALS